MTATRFAHEYCVVRVVPDIERGECLNVGVILVSRERRFLDARIHLDLRRLKALWPGVDDGAIELIGSHLDLIPMVCVGDPAGGPIARLRLGERWHWLTAPSSTIVQPGMHRTGLSEDPASELERLFGRLAVSSARRSGSPSSSTPSSI